MEVEQQPQVNESEERVGDAHSGGHGGDAQQKAKEARGTLRAREKGEQVLTLLKEGKEKVGALIIRDQSQRDREGAIRYIVKGMVKGFLIYTGPLCIIQRKITRPTVRRGVAVSIFVGLVRSFYRWHKWLQTLDAERDEQGRQRNRLIASVLHLFQQKLPWMAIAGGAAAWIGLKLDPSLLNSTLAFWCLVRAARCLPWPKWKYGPTAIMCFSATQILSSWIAAPEDLPEGYLRFLDKQGMINASMKKRLMGGELFCHVTHPGRTHFAYLWGFFRKCLLLSLRIYVPLNIIFFLATRKNMSGLQRAVENIVRSTAFLTSYCTLAIATGCFLYSNFSIKMTRPIMMSQAWVAGLATLIELPSRQSELAAYCLPFALETMYRYAQRMGWVVAKPWKTTTVIVLSVAALIHNLRKQPRLLNWLFGVM